MTTGKDRNAGPCFHSQAEDLICQPAAGMGRDDQIIMVQRHLPQVRLDKPCPLPQARPVLEQRGRKGRGTLRDVPVDSHGSRRAVVKQQQDLPQQPVTAGQIDNPSAPETAPYPPRDLPGLEQLLARQTPGTADRAGYGIEQGVPGKLREELFGKSIA